VSASAIELAEGELTLRRLELAVTRALDGVLHGDFRGLVPGAGSEAGEGRLYQPGDDVRRIDWNLTARTTVPHVRDTVAERELETWLVVDGTASLDFGTARYEKRWLAMAAVAAFGFLTASGGNRIGAVVYDGDGVTVLPPRGGRAAVMGLLRRLERRPRADEGAGVTPLAEALRKVRHVARRRGLVVVVSDLLDDGDWSRELRALTARHDVVVAQPRDPREDELPDVGLLMLVDPETGARREVQTSSKKLRRRFAGAAAERRADAVRQVRLAGATHLDLSTDRAWLLDVVRFVVARRRRR
jgi:uncharacterized protein (DUF58 family)